MYSQETDGNGINHSESSSLIARETSVIIELLHRHDRNVTFTSQRNDLK